MIFQIKARTPVFLETIAFADIVFNLFIFFLLSFGVLATFEPREQGTFPIELPKGGERVNGKETRPLTILIDASGTVYLERKVVSRSDLKRLVNQELAEKKVKEVLLRADRAETLDFLLPILEDR